MSTNTIKEQNRFSDAFQSSQASRGDQGPAWLERLRESAFDRFEQLGFPNTHQEDWKYTSVAPIEKLEFQPFIEDPSQGLAGETSLVEQLSYPETRQSQLVFANGRFRPELSDLTALPSGIVVLELSDALRDERYSDLIRQHLARHADYNADAFTALNTAFLSSGAFLLVSKGAVVNRPVHLLFVSDERATGSVCFPRVLVVAQADSSATLIESHSSSFDSTYWTNAVVELVLEDNARLKHYKLQHESTEAFHIATTTANLGPNSVLESTSITLGAKLSRHAINVRLDHEGSQCHVDGLYILGEGQHADTHSLIDHLLPRCTSRQLYKGILDGKSRAVFNGKVFVHKHAQQTDAQQTNRNLLLSNDARVDTKPQLEIFADDVKCAHGATVGQLEEEELFYLISRGLHRELAQNLLTFGFAEEVIDKIKIESIKHQLGETVLNRLHARLEV